MNSRRLSINSETGDSHYHIMTRCVNGESLLDEPSREILRKMLWKVSEFCNVKIITYAILPNHFHVLIHIPQRTPISDAELLRRYELLHPHYSPHMPARIEVIADWLKRHTVQAENFRQQQLALMFDLSSFMKLLKQRFSIWFNATHNRFGTLWAERFKSILVDYEGNTLRTMAAYIDLNAVRKGLVSDPKDYRWCGYAEALAGSRTARVGLRQVTNESSWPRTQSQYRLLLYSTGAAPRIKGHTIDTASFESVIDADGNIPLPDLLRHKWRYLTHGAILGSPSFIAQHRPLLVSRPHHPSPSTCLQQVSPSSTPITPSHPIPWGNVFTARRVHKPRRSNIR